MPENWVQRPVVNTEAGTNPGAPLAWGSPENPDDAVAGYGYVPCDTSEMEETFYYHSDHLGSTSYITDQKANVTQYDAYLPYGELLVDEHSSSADLPYKFNGKELDEETGLYYYGARYMNPVTGLFLNIDRYTENFPHFSPYVYSSANPIKYIDINGDSTVINDRGYINHYDRNDKDLRVFMNDKCIGSLGGEIDANGWFGNLLKDNADEASDIWSPYTFKEYVQQYGKWDYKYRSRYNNKTSVSKMKQHILGIAFYLKDSDKGIGKLKDTYFIFGDNPKARAEDLNNMHFGVVGKAINLFPEEFMLRQAGAAEMGKWKEDFGKGIRKTPYVPKSWRPVKTVYTTKERIPIPMLQWPYGDNPTDSRWIIRGFNHYKKGMR